MRGQECLNKGVLSEKVQMEVELDVFSGRPNPRLGLLPHQAREFTNILRRLLRQRKHAVPPEQGLGYRGFIVTGTSDELGNYDKVVVANGSVHARSGSVSLQLEDRDRALERWLLENIRGQVDDATYKYVLGEIDGS
jgi:hypothetical protein